MFKHRLIRWVSGAIALALLLVVVAVLFSQAGSEADPRIVRWGNVTLTEPPGRSDIVVARIFSHDDQPVILIGPRLEIESSLAIDPETGQVLEDRLAAEHRPAVQAVLNTIAVSPLDPNVVGWPYSADPGQLPRIRQNNITYIEPDPASGVRVWLAEAYGGGAFIEVRSTGSRIQIDAETGVEYQPARFIAPEDQAAFDRFVSEVRLIPEN